MAMTTATKIVARAAAVATIILDGRVIFFLLLLLGVCNSFIIYETYRDLRIFSLYIQ